VDRVRIFNTTKQTLCFTGEGLEEVGEELIVDGGKWIDAPRQFAVARLANHPNILVDWNGPQQPTVLPWPYLTVAAPLCRWIGYGTIGEWYVRHISKWVPIKLVPVGYWNRSSIYSKDVMALIDEERPGFTEWALCITIPPDLPKIPSPKKVMLSMWETDTLPNDQKYGGNWVEMTNALARALIVPCESQREMWRRDGVTIPIYVVALGVSDEFQYYERPQRSEGEPFTMLLYGSLTSRKSPIETVQACWSALGGREDWKLILKTRQGLLGAGAFTPVIEDSRIEVINADYSPTQMYDLHKRSDCGIFLSKYEGYGLPPREMMATGLPVIWTEYSGHTDDCDVSYNVPIPITGTMDANEGYDTLGLWGIPSWEAAIKAIRGQYEDWKERGRTQSEMGKRAAFWIRSRCDWERSAMAALEVVREVMDNEHRRP